MAVLRSLNEAVAWFDEQLAAHPERDMHACLRAVAEGRRRRWPVLVLAHLAVPGDAGTPLGEPELPRVEAAPGVEADLARDVVALAAPLAMDNPIAPCLGTGKGTGTMTASFGIPLDPATNWSPAFTRTLDEVLAEPPPDPATSGVMPEVRDRIRAVRDHLPPRFALSRPDMQGPFNIVHSIIGAEAFTAPHTDPEKFFRLMERVTRFWLDVRRTVLGWIGPERTPPGRGDRVVCECSVNLVSRRFYEEFILPHDRTIAAEIGTLAIHPCSGPHVFRATLDNLPVDWTEAGAIDRTAAGSISVGEALEAIGGRPIALSVGQELPPGREEEFIRADLDLYADHPRLTFAYTGMHWRRKDRPLIREIHRRLDEYWDSRYA